MIDLRTTFESEIMKLLVSSAFADLANTRPYEILNFGSKLRSTGCPRESSSLTPVAFSEEVT